MLKSERARYFSFEADRAGVTEEMIRAGSKALSESDAGLWSRGGTLEADLLTRIFVAMAAKAPK